MIVPTLARLLVREHLYQPIVGQVLCLGRQTIPMTQQQVVDLMHEEGFKPQTSALENLGQRRDEHTRYGAGKDFITDEVFFRLLGIEKVSVMDVSSYENADIIHNLNYPIRDSLVGKFDFIIDGGKKFLEKLKNF